MLMQPHAEKSNKTVIDLVTRRGFFGKSRPCRYTLHTHATHVLPSGATLTTVRDNLRHASISTTSIYLDDGKVQRTHQIERILTRRPSA